MSAIQFACDAVLFDMDGTLVDSTAAVERQWRRWAVRHGLDAEAILLRMHGRRAIETIREFAPHLATEEEAERFDEEEGRDRDGVEPIAGAPELVAALPPGAWAVVTSATPLLARQRLSTVRLPVPATLVTAADVRRGKPDPEGFLRAAALLGAAPARCLVIEDTPPGIEAGCAAGMQVLAMATTYPTEALGGAPAIRDFSSVRVVRDHGGLLISVTPIESHR